MKINKSPTICEGKFVNKILRVHAALHMEEKDRHILIQCFHVLYIDFVGMEDIGTCDIEILIKNN